MARISQTTKRFQMTKVLAGLGKRFAPTDTVVLQGKRYTVAQLKTLVQSQLDALDGIDAARAALTVAVRKERALTRGVSAVVLALRHSVLSNHGPRRDVLADFGWEPPKKPGPKTVAAKAKQVERARANREARKGGS